MFRAEIHASDSTRSTTKPLDSIIVGEASQAFIFKFLDRTSNAVRKTPALVWQAIAYTIESGTAVVLSPGIASASLVSETGLFPQAH